MNSLQTKSTKEEAPSPMDKSPKQVVTIFKDTVVPQFVIRLQNQPQPQYRFAPVRQETFYMMLSANSQKLNKFYLQIVEGKIYMRNREQGLVVAYIDIAYARIKLLKGVNVLGQTLHGIRFIKDKNYEEIFHQNLNLVTDWYDALKRYCVMSKFREIYSIKNEIGKGSFAKVYISQRNSDQKQFAVKIFDKKLIVQDEFERKCLLYELKMMREVEHPCLLQISELYEGDNNIYCLGKLYSGESLMSVISNRNILITQDMILCMAHRMLQALKYLEIKGIIHRDMKPENIVYTNKGDFREPVLIDLGFATFEKDYRLLFTRCGTPGYVGPEVLQDQQYTCKADVFSLGTILFSMVTRVNPFEPQNSANNSDITQLVNNNTAGRVDRNLLTRAMPNLSPNLIELIMLMLTVDQVRRPPASHILALFEQQFRV